MVYEGHGIYVVELVHTVRQDQELQICWFVPSLCQGGQALRPDLIDRSNFILGEHSPAVSPIKVEIISPIDERACSANYYRKKLEQAMAIIEKLQERPDLPSEAGVLDPKPPKQTSGSKRVTVNSGHGSIRQSLCRLPSTSISLF